MSKKKHLPFYKGSKIFILLNGVKLNIITILTVICLPYMFTLYVYFLLYYWSKLNKSIGIKNKLLSVYIQSWPPWMFEIIIY